MIMRLCLWSPDTEDPCRSNFRTWTNDYALFVFQLLAPGLNVCLYGAPLGSVHNVIGRNWRPLSLKFSIAQFAISPILAPNPQCRIGMITVTSRKLVFRMAFHAAKTPNFLDCKHLKIQLLVSRLSEFNDHAGPKEFSS
jgi:hypothetical protein